MTKVSVSISLDKEIFDLVSKSSKNKSEVINDILKRTYLTGEGISAQIAYLKSELQVWSKRLEEIKTKPSISPELKKKLVIAYDFLKQANFSDEHCQAWCNRIYNENKIKYTIIELKDLTEWAVSQYTEEEYEKILAEHKQERRPVGKLY